MHRAGGAAEAVKTKPFDCVEMKRRIQQEMAEEEARLGREETERRRAAWKESSAAPLARWWRTLTRTEETFTSAVLREEPPKP